MYTVCGAHLAVYPVDVRDLSPGLKTQESEIEIILI
jgi:hypothetical protein